MPVTTEIKHRSIASGQTILLERERILLLTARVRRDIVVSFITLLSSGIARKRIEESTGLFEKLLFDDQPYGKAQTVCCAAWKIYTFDYAVL
jgi:hypothetical protein